MQRTRYMDDEAVSPVIGVILMVAITVILAAVIATFVLGLGDSLNSQAPQVSFDYQYDETSGELTITHGGGDPIDEAKVGVRGGNTDNSPGVDWDGSGTVGDSDITAGDSYEYAAGSDDTVRIIWRAGPGGATATLGVWEGT
ncbi:type IV pilin N-terminal domain-containing protein [Haloarcula laminariae]|uniref:type IV pilin N-terminal domain-containing protein n=1 Tax=Haloarcula laminariae TaxID=2961577 RepID=UPI0021C66456|nr:type IV pilin N-terminal domain-containing protein [Halomicroarcula laminariae]